MTQEEKAKAYDKALEIAKSYYGPACNEFLDTIFPQLRESEDERIRKELVAVLEDLILPDDQRRRFLAYLEKQKGKMTAEEYEKSELFQLKSKTKYADGYQDGIVQQQEKQKELHYADKRVDDIMNMPELSAFEQALTNFIGYWEDDEEHWPSQFVKKNGKHILDMAREELQKEQKPEQYSPLCVTIKDKIHEYIANHFIADTVVKTDVKSIVKAMEEGVRLGKEEQKSVDLPAGFYVTLPDGKKYYTKEMRCNGMNVKVVEPKPAEWSVEDKSFYDSIMCEVIKEGMHPTPEQANWFKLLPERFNLQPRQEWSEEDEKELDCIINILDRLGYEEFCKSSRDQDIEEERFYYKEIQFLKRLKSIRPSWEPGEEQMRCLKMVLSSEAMDDNVHDVLIELYEQLKKL